MIRRVVLFALALASSALLGACGDMKASDAAERGLVDIAITGQGAESVQMTLSLAGGRNDLEVVVPVGTVIRNSDGQNLVVARSVTFYLHRNSNGGSETQTVPTYCLDQFLDPPTEDSSLQMASTSDSIVEETNPVRRLVRCLEREAVAHEAGQAAVWMVNEGFLNMSYDRARQHMRDRYRVGVVRQVNELMNTTVRERLRSRLPGISGTAIEEGLARYRANHFNQAVEDSLTEKVDQILGRFTADAKPALDRCGYRTRDLTFFQSAGAGG